MHHLQIWPHLDRASFLFERAVSQQLKRNKLAVSKRPQVPRFCAAPCFLGPRPAWELLISWQWQADSSSQSYGFPVRRLGSSMPSSPPPTGPFPSTESLRRGVQVFKNMKMLRPYARLRV
jgi:hypothetical protein